MATFRKRNGKWQVIVRHKSIGTVSRSFIVKTQAIKWALEQEERIERGVFGCIEPSEIALSDLLQRYSKEITPAKRGAAIEMYRLRRLINDPISNSLHRSTHVTGACKLQGQKAQRWTPRLSARPHPHQTLSKDSDE